MLTRPLRAGGFSLRLIATLAVPFLIVSIALGAARADGQPCAPGSFGANGFEPCTQCDAGTFAANPGATSCEPCAIGNFSFVGSSSCLSCGLGSYAPQPGAGTCTPCEPGRYADFFGSSECQACPPGYFADQSGQSSCLLCSAGTFAADPGSSACQPCAAGRYNEVLGAAACSECSAGTFSSEVGAISSQTCTPCPTGQFSGNPGAAACSACPRNSFAPDTGLTHCVACGCDDAVACTRDSCNAVSGTCSAPVVSMCQRIDVFFSGTVTYVDSPLAAATPLGAPVEGRFSYDPEAPDATPLDPVLGDYPNAVTGFGVSIGAGSLISATSPRGSMHVVNGGASGDVVAFQTSAADGLAGPPLGALPDGVRESYLLRLADAGATALASDALPTAPPDFSLFANRLASLEIHSPTEGTVYVDSDDVQAVPEPHAALRAATALAGLLALARRSGRAYPPRERSGTSSP
jgi:hypothetical protein